MCEKHACEMSSHTWQLQALGISAAEVPVFLGAAIFMHEWTHAESPCILENLNSQDKVSGLGHLAFQSLGDEIESVKVSPGLQGN